MSREQQSLTRLKFMYLNLNRNNKRILRKAVPLKATRKFLCKMCVMQVSVKAINVYNFEYSLVKHIENANNKDCLEQCR